MTRRLQRGSIACVDKAEIVLDDPSEFRILERNAGRANCEGRIARQLRKFRHHTHRSGQNLLKPRCQRHLPLVNPRSLKCEQRDVTAITLEGDQCPSLGHTLLASRSKNSGCYAGISECDMTMLGATVRCLNVASGCQPSDLPHTSHCPRSLTISKNCRKLLPILSGVTDSDEGRCVRRQFKHWFSAEQI